METFPTVIFTRSHTLCTGTTRNRQRSERSRSVKLIRASNKVRIYSPKGNNKYLDVPNPITALSCDDRFIVTADYDALLSIYDRNTRTFEFSIPTFCKGIKCLCVSNKFHVIVCGTKDRTLVISSTTLKSVVRSIPLDGRPERVLITPSWGFIVVYLTKIEDNAIKHQLAVLTVNGILIRKANIEDAVTMFSVWSSPASFDYVLMGDVMNRVFAFEAFYIDLRLVGQFSSEISGLFYWAKENQVVVIFRSGDVCQVNYPCVKNE